MFYRSRFYHSKVCYSMFYHPIFYHSTPCFTTPLHSIPCLIVCRMTSEAFYTEMISAVNLDDSQLVTLELGSDHYLRFHSRHRGTIQRNPGEPTKDCSLKRVTPLNTQLAAYGGLKPASCGSSAITVWGDDLKCKLDCKLVEKSTIRPLLGRKACVGVKIIKYTDNDELSKLQTGNTPVYSLERVTMEKVKPVPITREELIEKYPDVFGDGVGKFALNTTSD